jgi:eukaryotic-like serine/threonine-protein kinase
VHHDLKPGNIMLTKPGTGRQASVEAKLLDFGLAKLHPLGAAVATQRAGELQTRTAPLTGKAAILGTLPYMAPEQIEGGEVDARTDIFALGLVVYEMLTGKRAFEGETQASVIGAILKDTPAPIATLQPSVPAALDHVVSTCLSKDPEDRWQSTRDVLRSLTWIRNAGISAVGVDCGVVGHADRERCSCGPGRGGDRRDCRDWPRDFRAAPWTCC